MTDKKLTDEEIIKALTEDLIAATNRYSAHLENGGRIDENQEQYIEMLTEIINLINRQRAEIERLKECPKCVYEYDGEVMEYCVQSPCSNFKTIEQIKAEAYKEFAKTVKDKWFNKDYYSPDVDFDDFVDNLLKEMVGEEE